MWHPAAALWAALACLPLQAAANPCLSQSPCDQLQGGCLQHFVLGSQADVACLASLGCKEVTSLQLRFAGDFSSLATLERVTQKVSISARGRLSLRGLENLNFTSTLEIKGTNGLANLKGLESLEQVGDLIILENTALRSLSGLSSLKNVDRRAEFVRNPALESLAGIESLQEILQGFTVMGNHALTSLLGLSGLKYCWGEMRVGSMNGLLSLGGLDSLLVLGGFRADGLPKLERLAGLLSGGSVRLLNIEESAWPRCVTPQERQHLWLAAQQGAATLGAQKATEGQDSLGPSREANVLAANQVQGTLPLARWTPDCGPEPFSCWVGVACEVPLNARATLQISASGCKPCSLKRMVTVQDGKLAVNTTKLGPGNFTVCGCEDQRPAAQLYILGPAMVQASQLCHRAMSTCRLRIQGAGFREGEELEARLGCDGKMVAKGIFADSGFDFTMKTVMPGSYSLCWLPPCEGCRMMEIGGLDLMGPFSNDERAVTGVWHRVTDSGLGKLKSTSMAVMRSCGQGEVLARAESEKGVYLVNLAGFAPGQYRKCWCDILQGAGCVALESWSIDIGEIDLLCGAGEGYALGECVACAAGYSKPMPGNHKCEIDDEYISKLVVESALWMILAHILLVQLRTPIRIDDSARCMSGNLQLACFKDHGLHMAGRRSFPISISGSGQRYLDKSCCKGFSGRVVDSQHIELLPSCDCAEQQQREHHVSRGYIHLRLRDELLHLGHIPIGIQLAVVLPLAVAVQIFVEQQLLHRFGIIAVIAVLAGALRLWRRRKNRTWTCLDEKVSAYRRHLLKGRESVSTTESGPNRAVELGALWDLEEFFSTYVRQRDAYYLDANILRPLTAPFKVSFAELAGPQRVQWFVSHSWGNPFLDLCKSLRKHAETLNVPASSPVGRLKTTSSRWTAGMAWRKTTYWICFLSNNQYLLKEELGDSVTSSSFFRTLTSGSCKGVCLVLDDMATPLMRAWCIFELLQTVKLERCAEDFSGLLLCTAGGVLNHGQGSVEVAMNLVERIANLDLASAGASRKEDKEMINAEVVQELGSFRELNRLVQAKLRALLATARSRADSHFEELFVQLDECKSGESANTPVHFG